MKLKHSMRHEEQERKQASYLAAGERMTGRHRSSFANATAGVSTAPAI
jgi:hypothetical protein